MRYFQHESRKAIWSQRLGLVFLLLFLITFGLHRFSQINTPVAMHLFSVAVVGAVAAVLLGAAALTGIWREGHKGAGRALTGVFFGALLLALPLWSLPDLMSLPRINDVTTDVKSPPRFEKIALVRQGEANPPIYRREAADLQQQAYPDLEPLVVTRSASETFSAVRDAVSSLSWRIVSEEPPQAGRPGAIEAVDRSMIFGFTDDVVVRVSGDDRKARIDARSASRYGEHDLGRNAERVRGFFTEVKTRLAAIETSEQMQKAVILREEQAKKARKKEEGRKSRSWRDELDREGAPRQSLRNPDAAPQTSALDPARSPSQPTPQERIQPQGRLDLETERGLSRGDARYERKRQKRQRREARRRAARRFWEQYGVPY
jgi:uncharacterized protein (DUF1499 family)